MKIKIKNFVFAGFAAAIFAGNAMAAGDTIVTSKAYVDQKLGLKANTADLAAVATSGSYTDLLNKPTIPAAQVNADWNASSGVAQILNKPTIPTVPTNVSAFTNDANYATTSQLPTIDTELSPVSTNPVENQAVTSAIAGINTNIQSLQQNKQNNINADNKLSYQYVDGLATVAHSGSYNDLSNKPTIPTVPTNVSAFTNDANYITSADVPAQVNADWNASSGAGEILNKPTLGTAAAAATTDFATAAQGALAASAVQPGDLATVATTGSYNDLSNKPTIPAAQVNADWNSTSGVSQILNKPTLSAVATSGNYSDLSGTPTLATVATSGSYTDLADKPTIPAAQVQSDWNATTGMGAILNKPTLSAVATSGNYSDLSGTPTLATVATSGSYTDLADKPTIPAAQVQSDWNATTGMGAILNKPTLGTAAAAATTDFATAAQGALADTAIQPGTCTADAPCAMVNNQWVRIAQVGD